MPPEVFKLSNGLSAIIVRGDAIDFDAVVEDSALDQLCRIGSIPTELREQTRAWARLTAIFTMIERFERDDLAGSGVTRRQRRQELQALRRQLKRGGAIDIDTWLCAELRAIVGAKLKFERLGVPWWRPANSAPIDEVIAVMREADKRVREALADRDGLIALVELALDALKEAPDRGPESHAREGQTDDATRVAVESAMGFWENQLGRTERTTDQLVAFVDIVLRILGMPKEKARAVRAQIEAARDRRRA